MGDRYIRNENRIIIIQFLNNYYLRYNHMIICYDIELVCL